MRLGVMMAALDLVGSLLVAVYGLGLMWHYGLMCVAAKRAPVVMLIAYPVAAVCGCFALLFAGASIWQAVAGIAATGYLLAALWVSVLGGSAALVVALRIHRAGVHVCDVMDSAAALKAARQVHAVVADAGQKASMARKYVTPSAWDYLASQEQDPRDNPRKDAT